MSSDNKISVETYEIKKNKKKIKKKFDFTQGDTWRHTATYGDIWRHMAPHGDTWRHVAPHGDTVTS
jgi:hypothetical protein